MEMRAKLPKFDMLASLVAYASLVGRGTHSTCMYVGVVWVVVLVSPLCHIIQRRTCSSRMESEEGSHQPWFQIVEQILGKFAPELVLDISLIPGSNINRRKIGNVERVVLIMGCDEDTRHKP